MFVFIYLNAFACFQLQNQIKQLQSKYLCLQTGNFVFFFCCCFFHFELVLFCICYVALTQMLEKTEGDNTSAPLLIHSSKQYPAIDPC